MLPPALRELDDATMLVLSYYFGTSASSRAKDDTLAQIAKTLTFDSFNVRAELAALAKESKELEELVGAEDDSIRDFDSVLRR